MGILVIVMALQHFTGCLEARLYPPQHFLLTKLQVQFTSALHNYVTKSPFMLEVVKPFISSL